MRASAVAEGVVSAVAAAAFLGAAVYLYRRYSRAGQIDLTPARATIDNGIADAWRQTLDTTQTNIFANLKVPTL